MTIPKKTITEIIRFCNRDLVPDSEFNAATQHHNEWFVSYFSFLANRQLESHLGDAFYQARFMYKLMNALQLPLAKQRGIVKAQIIQYASICEAVLDTAIEKYYKDVAEKRFEVTEYKNTSALSKTTKITVNGCEAFVCTQKKIKGDLKRTRMDFKTEFAAHKGLISGDVKAAFDNLYDLRNNIHILKAVGNSYTPKLREAKDAYLLMQKLVGEIKAFYASHQ